MKNGNAVERTGRVQSAREMLRLGPRIIVGDKVVYLGTALLRKGVMVAVSSAAGVGFAAGLLVGRIWR